MSEKNIRIKPYTTNQVSWNSILEKILRIPMNQREYSWGAEEINKFLDDIFHIFEEDKYVEKMGSIINLEYKGNNDIYDGQQRILTTILILNVLSSLSNKLKNKINTLLTIDTELDTLSEEQEELKTKWNVSIIPKIYCINPYDMEGLVNIFNDKVQSWMEYLTDDNFCNDEETYVCKICKTSVKRLTNFKRHICEQHGFIEYNNTTKLYKAYIEIYNYIVHKRYSDTDMIKLYKFILHDIDIQYYNCTDPQYVSRIFDWENNRGKSVESLDIIKNPILVQIPHDKKVEVYEKWEQLKHKPNKIYRKDFGQKIFDVAIQLYNRKIERSLNHEELFKPIINDNDTYSEINKFFKIVEKLFDIVDKISYDRFGKLLNNTPRICLNWEAYMWCLLPILYETDDKTDGHAVLIKLLTQWYFRNLQFKTRSFNNLCYSTEFIKISNEVLNDKNYDYYMEIKKCLDKNKDTLINDEKYVDSIKEMNFKSTNATHLLLFLETCLNSDLCVVSLDFTLEHIIPQKDKTKLTNSSLMDNIGNLTLLEGKNSSNGHTGNCSLGSKPYSIKKGSYKKSCARITMKLSDEYETFEENDILKRNEDIVKQLNNFTKYF